MPTEEASGVNFNTLINDVSNINNDIENCDKNINLINNNLMLTPESYKEVHLQLISGQSLTIYEYIKQYIPAYTSFGITISTNAQINGDFSVYVYNTDGTAKNLGIINTNIMKSLFVTYDIDKIAFYISGSAILSSGTLTIKISILYDSTDPLEYYTDKVKYNQIVQTEDRVNLFTRWIVATLDSTNGKIAYGNNLVSAGYIEVTPGETYIINDPDKISNNARNAQFVYEYDKNYTLVNKISITTNEVITVSANTTFIRLRSQTVGIQNYEVGDFSKFKTFVYKGNEIKPYSEIAPFAKLKYSAAKGENNSANLFSGNAFLCSNINYTTGLVNATGDLIILATDFIHVTNTVYWQIFDGKTGDVQFLFEYDSNKNFIKYTTLGTGTSAINILDSATEYIRFRSQTASETTGYELPSIEWFNKHFMVSDKPIIRYQQYYPVISQRNVSNNFYDTAIDFSSFEYLKEAADAYIDEIYSGAYDVVIPLISDVHSEKPDGYSLHNYIASSGVADVAFNLGDNIPSKYPSLQQAISQLKMVFHTEYYKPRKCEVYVLCGNHDYNPTNNNSVDYTINQQLYYSLSQARTKHGYAESGVNYGFIDLDAAKVRVIWIDSADIFDNETGEPLTNGTNTIVQQKQFTWFCNVALNFMDKPDRNKWSVLTLSHDRLTALSNNGFTNVIKAFINGTSTSGTAQCVGRGSTILQQYDVDFTEQGPVDYICHINGHYHDDNAIEIGDTGKWQIQMPCDNLVASYYENGEEIAYTRTKHTIEDHCIDTFCLDKKNRKIYMKRLGVGSDREFSY